MVNKTEEIEGQAEAVLADYAIMKEDTAMMHSRKRAGKWKMARSKEECERGMKRSSRRGHAKDAAAAWMEGDKMPQMPGWRGTRCRRRRTECQCAKT